ncbi:uncharacterized protein [Drosophila tropicalis]|uniref:uncharacterized protein n=1 Tax=Drosophila tropicalis TaxID=46794 RepID=UPI0035AB7775
MSLSIVPAEDDEVTISTSNGDIYHIKRVLAEQMETIRNKMAASGNPYIIPLVDTDSSTFVLVLKWCTLMHNLRYTSMTVDISRGIFNGFMHVFGINRSMLMKLIMASYKLQISSLSNATTRRVADEIRACQTAEEARIHFGVYDAPQDG